MAQPFVPGGSYKLTTENIKVTLHGRARKVNQTWVDASLDLTTLDSADIENIDGVLRNTGKSLPAKGYVPGGSYAQTTTDIRVLLTGKARKKNGEKVDAVLDLTSLANADVANIDGRLIDMSHIDQAHTVMQQWFPEHAADLARHKDAITGSIVYNKPAAPSAPTAQPTFSVGPVTVTLTPCEEAIAGSGVSLILLALGMVGLKVSSTEAATRALLREIGPDTLRGFSRMFANYSSAQGAVNKAKAAFSILGAFYNAGALKGILKEIAASMSWWDWVKTGVVAIAQFIAWFATDGAAFIAEATIVVVNTESFAESVSNTVKTCAA